MTEITIMKKQIVIVIS